MRRKDSLRNVELRLICALMKNGRRSDRELARTVGVSQPTVSRTRMKLEKEGIIKEYTMIPDFAKLGFEIMAITFVRFARELSRQEYDKFRKYCRGLEEKSHKEAILMAMNGMGLGYDRVFISFHKDYSSYLKVMTEVRKIQGFNPSHVDSFMISLTGETHFHPLTLSVIADYLLETSESHS